MKLSVVALIFLLAGCAAGSNPKVDAYRTEFVRTIPTCQTERECEVKWATARRWVLENAGMKLQHVTNDFLETFNSPEYSGRLAVRVVKEPLQGGSGYRIVITTQCSPNLVLAASGGCMGGNTWEHALRFNAYVNAAQ